MVRARCVRQVVASDDSFNTAALAQVDSLPIFLSWFVCFSQECKAKEVAGAARQQDMLHGAWSMQDADAGGESGRSWLPYAS